MFSLFQSSPVLDEDAATWLFDTFAWSLKHFDRDLFFNYTQLVLPNNDYFPGRGESVEEMANLICDRVKAYAGISHWPTRLSDLSACSINPTLPIEISGPLRLADGEQSESNEGVLEILYNPQQLSNPEGMIASFAHTFSHYLAQMAKEPPPGGVEYWPHTTELLAVYLGFGLMFANSAFTFRGGCGSCYNPNANRDAYLTEVEATYALAIFATLKGIPSSAVTKHLKKHLRSIFKQSVKDIESQPARIQLLK